MVLLALACRSKGFYFNCGWNPVHTLQEAIVCSLCICDPYALAELDEGQMNADMAVPVCCQQFVQREG